MREMTMHREGPRLSKLERTRQIHPKSSLVPLQIKYNRQCQKELLVRRYIDCWPCGRLTAVSGRCVSLCPTDPRLGDAGHLALSSALLKRWLVAQGDAFLFVFRSTLIF